MPYLNSIALLLFPHFHFNPALVPEFSSTQQLVSGDQVATKMTSPAHAPPDKSHGLLLVDSQSLRD